MSILRDFERRLEGAVEGFFARVFRSGLQPVELAKAVQRYMGNYQQVGLDGVIVPNVFRFSLASEDLDRFGGYTQSLQRELADVVSKTASDRGWLLKGPVRIEFEESQETRVGTYELRGKIEASQPESRRQPEVVEEPHNAASRGGHTRTYAAPRGHGTAHPPRADEPAPTRAVLRGNTGDPSVIARKATLGRLPDCDVPLNDQSVSRHHARLEPTGRGWIVEDLDSTNGVRVNGERVHRAELRSGDRLELGNVRLVFSLEE
jgi:predicted component of type VI protein secretion system